MGANAGIQSKSPTTKRARIAKVARIVMIGAGVTAGSLGSLIMRGHRELLPVHELAGDVAILTLWTLAYVGWRAGIARGKVALAAVWGMVELSLVGLQQLALGPTAHAVTQALHVASSIGVVAGGVLLARAVLWREAAGNTGLPAAIEGSLDTTPSCLRWWRERRRACGAMR